MKSGIIHYDLNIRPFVIVEWVMKEPGRGISTNG